MLYTQFDDKKSKCRDARIESNLPEEILSDLKKLTKAGIIKIIYLEKFLQIAQDINSTLQKAGYDSETLLDNDEICAEEVYENSEGIILLGSSLGNKFAGKKCLIVADSLDLFDILHQEYHLVLVYDKYMAQSGCNEIAGVYGSLMTKLIACFDLKLSCLWGNHRENLHIAEEIEDIIAGLFLKNYPYYHDEIFIRDLALAVINIGVLESMLTDSEMLDGYKICSLVVQNMAREKNNSGEFSMLVGWFIINVIKSQIKNKNKDLFLPCDIMADIDFVAEKTNISKINLLKIVSDIVAKEYTRMNFISREYIGEIEKYLNKIYPAGQNAMKNFRRIYFDAGLQVSSSITLNGLAKGVFRSVPFNPRYSYIKMFRVLGAV